MRADRRRFTTAAVAATAGGWWSPAVGATPLHVVASFSILGDIVRQVSGDAAVVETLVGPDADAHVFEPTPEDARRLARADLVVINGLGFEGWLPRLIAASGYRGPVAVAAEGVATRTQSVTTDPHIWQDLSNGMRMADNVAQALQRASPADATAINRRQTAYVAALSALDRSIRERFDRIPRSQRRMLTSHDAFGYFGAAYGVYVVAPLPSNSESEPSAARVGRLIEQLRVQTVRAVFIENITDPRLVERMAHDAGARVGGKLYSDALSRPSGEAANYLALMAHNATTILAALQP